MQLSCVGGTARIGERKVFLISDETAHFSMDCLLERWS